VTTKQLEAMRGLFVEELVSTVLARHSPQTILRLARLVKDCDERLQRQRVAAIEADVPSLERRQTIAAYRDPPKKAGG
jgi:hypothetical protein